MTSASISSDSLSVQSGEKKAFSTAANNQSSLCIFGQSSFEITTNDLPVGFESSKCSFHNIPESCH